MYVRVELALRARPPRHKATSAAAAAAAATAVRTHVRAYTHTYRIERVCLARPIKHTCVHANTRTYIRACTKSNGICSATCQRCLRDRFAQTPFGRAVYVYVTDGRVAFELADMMLGDGSAWHYVLQRAREPPLCWRVWEKSPVPKRACVAVACPQQDEAAEQDTHTNEQQAVHQVEEQAADEQATERDEETKDEDTAEEDYTEEGEEEDSAACPSTDPIVAELNRLGILIGGGVFLDGACLVAECA